MLDAMAAERGLRPWAGTEEPAFFWRDAWKQNELVRSSSRVKNLMQAHIVAIAAP